MKRIWCITLALLTALSACGGRAESRPESSAAAPSADPLALEASETQVFAMDTYMNLKAYGSVAPEALQEAAAELQRLDGLLSVTDENSEIYAVNHGGAAVPVSPDTAALLEQTLALGRETGGALSAALYPVSRLWGFTTGSYRVPSQEEIDALLPLAEDSQVALDESAGTIKLPAGAELDLGAVAKGYAADRLTELLQDKGVTSALLSLGGSTIRTLGKKPEGGYWRIAIQDPRDPQNTAAYAGILELGEGAVNTSGGYERYFEQDGQVYWHILDPATGRPARSGLISVTVITDDALAGDGLSTALFVMGLEKATAFWRSREDFEFVMIAESGDLYVSQGAAAWFRPMGDYESASLTVVPRAE